MVTLPGEDAMENNTSSDKHQLSEDFHHTFVKVDGGLESDLVRDFDENLTGLGLDIGSSPYNMREVLNLPIFKEETLFGDAAEMPRLQYTLCAPTSPATKLHEESLTYLNQGQSYEIRLKKMRDVPGLCLSTLVKSKIRVTFHDRRLQYQENQQFETWKVSRPGDRLLNIDVPMSVGVVHPTEHPDQLNLAEFVWDTEKEVSVWVQVHCISTEFTARKHGGEKGVPFRIQIDTFVLENSHDVGQHIHSASCQIKVFKPKGADRKQKTDKDKMEKRPTQERHKYQPSFEFTMLKECMLMNQVTTEQSADDALIQSVTTTAHANRMMPPGTPGSVYTDITSFSSPHITYQMNSNYDVVGRVRNNQLTDAYNSCTGSSGETINTQVYFQKPSSSSSSLQFSATTAPKPPEQLLPSSSVSETQIWLNYHRFGTFAKSMHNFSGSDLLTLSRDDLIQICGSAEGIRLFNALRAKAIHPRLTLFLTREEKSKSSNSDTLTIYKAYYLEKATLQELVEAVTSCILDDNSTFSIVVGGGNSRSSPTMTESNSSDGLHQYISRLLYLNNSCKHVLVTDQVVSVMKNESSFSCSVMKSEGGANTVVLKPT